MKKILIFSNHPAYTYNLRKEIIEGFMSAGYKVTLVVPYGKEVDTFKELGVKLIDISIEERSKNPFKDLSLLRTNLKILKSESPDVVLTFATKQNIYGGLAARMSRIPYIPMITGLGTAIENPGLLKAITSFLYRNGLKNAEALLVQNAFIYEKLKLLNMINCPVFMTPGSGVSLDRHELKPYPPADEHISFVYIGRIMRDKGIYELIEAAKQIKNENLNVSFKVIGHGNLEEDIRLVEKADKEGYIEYLGRQEDVRPYIESAHATVLPSYHEGMANVLLESASAGRPVIASRVPGCSETFDEGISGLGFDVKDVGSLVNSLKAFVQLPYNEKKLMGLAGREKMKNEFDRSIILKQYIKIIEKIG